MSNWNQKYQDEIRALEHVFERFRWNWADLYIDFKKERPESLDDFIKAVHEMLGAFVLFQEDIEEINAED